MRHPRDAQVLPGTSPSGNASANDIPEVETEEASGPSRGARNSAPRPDVPDGSLQLPQDPPRVDSDAEPRQKRKTNRERGPDTQPIDPQPDLSTNTSASSRRFSDFSVSCPRC